MRKRRFVRCDSRVPDRLRDDENVCRNNEPDFRKRVRGLCDTWLVEPDDVLVRVRNLCSVMAEMTGLGPFMLMGPKMAVSDGGVIAPIRLVHVLLGEHRRHGEPWQQSDNDQDSSNRSHQPIRLYAPEGTPGQADEEFRNSSEVMLLRGRPLRASRLVN